jgi:hypothetical protein
MADSKQTKSVRTRRSPINGTRNRLNVRGKEPGYVYRIVNDIDDRIQTFQEMGYEIVSDSNVSVGDKRVADATQEGSPIKVSVGQGVQAYVMRQKQEWYDEDKVKKQEYVNELERSMKEDASKEGFYGKLNLSRD